MPAASLILAIFPFRDALWLQKAFEAAASFVRCFGRWLLPPPLLGRAEPWDADWPVYPLVLLMGGAAIGQ